MNLADLQYELAMAMGSSLDLQSVLYTVTRILLRGLDGVGVAVYRFVDHNEGELVFKLPRSARYEPLIQARKPAAVAAVLEGVGGEEGQGYSHRGGYQWERLDHELLRHRLEIPEFGVLFLDRLGKPFGDPVVLALDPLMTRLGQTARACLAYEELQTSHERFDKLVAALPEMIFEGRLSPDGEFVFSYVSPPAADLLGVSAEKLVANSDLFFEQLVREDREALRQVLAGRGGSREPLDQLVRRKVGEEGGYWLRLVARHTGKSNHDQWSGILEDVDARERLAAAELASSQLRKSALLSAAADAIMVSSVDGTITDWNRGAEYLLGYTAQEAIGRNVTLIMPEIMHRIHHEGTERHLATGIRGMIGQTREELVLDKAGNEFPVEVVLSRVEDGQESFFVAVLRDLRPRQQAEAERERAREQERGLNRTLTELGQLAVSEHLLFESRLVRVIGESLNLDRVSLWDLDEGALKLRQRWDREQRGEANHGAFLEGRIGAEYMEALNRGSIVISNKARDWERQRGLLEGEPGAGTAEALMVISLRDLHGEVYGILRMEDFGERAWSDPERAFGNDLALLISRVDARNQSEQEISKERERLDYVLSNASAIIYSAALTGMQFDDVSVQLDYVSNSAHDVLGYSIEEMKIPGFWEGVIHPDDQQRVFEGLADLFAKGEHTHEYRQRHANGDYRWLRDQVKVLTNEEGVPYRVVGSSFDITDRKVGEQKIAALLAVQQMVSDTSRAFLNSAVDVNVTIGTTLENIGSYTNSDRAYIYEKKGEFLANTQQWCAEGVNSYLEELQNWPASDLALCMEVLESGGALEIDSLSELGEDAAWERKMFLSLGIEQLVAVPLMNSGQLMGFLGIDNPGLAGMTLKDLSPLLRILADTVVAGKKSQEAEIALRALNNSLEERVEKRTAELRESEQRFLSLFKQAPQAMMLVGPDYRVAQANDAARTLFGLASEDVPGIDVFRLLPQTLWDEENSGFREPFEQKVDGLQGCRETQAYRCDGSLFYGEISLQPMVLRGGQVYTLAGISDVTARRAAESSLQASQEEMQRLNRLMQSVIDSPRDLVVFSIDQEYRYIALTQAHRQVMKFIWGRDVEVGDSILDIINREDDRARAKDNFDRCLNGEYYLLEEDYGEGTENRRSYEIRYNPLVDAQGAVFGCTVFNLDVTERKRREQAEERARSYRELMGGLSTEALGVESVEVFQEKFLALVGETLEVSHAYIFGRKEDSENLRHISGWNRPQWTPTRDFLPMIFGDEDRYSGEFPDGLAQLFRGEDLRITALSEMRHDLLRGILETQGVKSIFCVPLFIGSRFRGFLGISDCELAREWSTEERDLLGGAARILLGVWVEDELRQSERRFQGVLRNVSNVAVIGYNLEGRVRYWNQAAQRMYGYSEEEAVGGHIGELIFTEDSRLMLEEALVRAAREGADGLGGEGAMRHKDGSTIHVLSSTTLVEVRSEGMEFFRIDADLSSIKDAERLLVESLREKETLLKEIHHRVKNNLQMISGLLSLQSAKAKVPETKAFLEESVGRVRSMALIHQQIYGVDSLDRVEFDGYIRTLARTLQSSLAPYAGLEIRSVPVFLSVEQAIPLGLVLNELLTNAFKYGLPEEFEQRPMPGERKMHIWLTLEKSDTRISMRLQDSGPGLPEGFDMAQSRTLGLRLVQSLVGQLRGRLEYSHDGGASFEVSFETE